jgi:hypothetical protein
MPQTIDALIFSPFRLLQASPNARLPAIGGRPHIALVRAGEDGASSPWAFRRPAGKMTLSMERSR